MASCLPKVVVCGPKGQKAHTSQKLDPVNSFCFLVSNKFGIQIEEMNKLLLF